MLVPLMALSRPLVGLIASAVLLAAPGAAVAQPWEANQAVQRTITLDRDRTGELLVITPENFQRDGVHPVLLVFGGGPGWVPQLSAAMAMFDPECRKRGWVVVGLATPTGSKPTEPRATDVLRVLQEVRQIVRIEGNRVHVAGPSNGGTASLALAFERPDLVASVLAFPGAVSPKALPQVDRLRGIPVRLIVGSDDQVEWAESARALTERGKAAEVNIEYEIRPAQGHILRDLTAADLLDRLEPFRPRTGTLGPEIAAAWRVLDDFHTAAHLAQEDRYFAHFAPEGVFLGTDAEERWTEQFRAYAHPLFSKGRGWSYWLRERHVTLLPDGQTAAFDEILDHEKYGVSRGSGILRRVAAKPAGGADSPGWVISQYHLTFPIPNDLAERVTRMIRTESERRKK